jgi:signal transduction histidine kinase
VSDQGAGFSEEDRKFIYQKFKRLSAQPTGGEPSTGLGLAIVKQFVDRLGGEIELHSKLGEGATFKILFASNN